MDIAFPSDWGLAAFVILLVWAALATYHDLHKRTATKHRPNMTVCNALRYMINESRWPLQDRAPGQPILDAAKELRRAAALGDLIVWGKTGGSHFAIALGDEGVPEPIPTSFWVHGQIDVMDCLDTNGTGGKTEAASPVRSIQSYSGLEVDKTQVLACWPRKRLVGRIIKRWRVANT